MILLSPPQPTRGEGEVARNLAEAPENTQKDGRRFLPVVCDYNSLIGIEEYCDAAYNVTDHAR
jgi:hypothetical protein